jgi:hypothetical protein
VIFVGNHEVAGPKFGALFQLCYYIIIVIMDTRAGDEIMLDITFSSVISMMK